MNTRMSLMALVAAALAVAVVVPADAQRGGSGQGRQAGSQAHQPAGRTSDQAVETMRARAAAEEQERQRIEAERTAEQQRTAEQERNALEERERMMREADATGEPLRAEQNKTLQER